MPAVVQTAGALGGALVAAGGGRWRGCAAARRHRRRASVRRRSAELVEDVRRRGFAALGVSCPLAIAPTAAAAWALAHYGSAPMIICGKDTGAKLADLPVAALRFAAGSDADAGAAGPQDHRHAGRDRAAVARPALPRRGQSGRCARPRARPQARAADRRSCRPAAARLAQAGRAGDASGSAAARRWSG